MSGLLIYQNPNLFYQFFFSCFKLPFFFKFAYSLRFRLLKKVSWRQFFGETMYITPKISSFEPLTTHIRCVRAMLCCFTNSPKSQFCLKLFLWFSNFWCYSVKLYCREIFQTILSGLPFVHSPMSTYNLLRNSHVNHFPPVLQNDGETHLLLRTRLLKVLNPFHVSLIYLKFKWTGLFETFDFKHKKNSSIKSLIS